MGRLRKSIGGRASPRTYGVSALRKPPSFRGRRPGLPVFADKRQVNVLKKGLNVLNNGNDDGTASGAGTASSTEDKKIPMKVAVRVRPLSSRESTVNAREIMTVSGPKMLVFDPERQNDDFYFKNQKIKDVTAKKHKNITFAFDHVYDKSSTNTEIYEDIMKPLMDTLLSGFNCSVFAYGATGSGKTYTMLGSPGNPGLTYLTINDLYERLDSIKEDFRVDIGVSYFEVYNEQIHDLLHHTGTHLQIMEKGGGKLEIKNLSEHKPQNVDELFDMLRMGNLNRSQHPTDHNAESSRSHAILQVTIHMHEKHSSKLASKKSAKLVMVDLAGSEKGCATGFSGQRFQEGSSINKSLLALGKVMETLATGKKAFTYRDSKLTRILKDSLGGNSRTVMIANVSPAEGLFDDTLNTLRYAQKAKKISCDASKNVITVRSCLTEYTRVVDEMTTKIQKLEQQVKEKDERLLEIGQLQNERDDAIRKLSDAEERVKNLQIHLAETEQKLRNVEFQQQGHSDENACTVKMLRPLQPGEKLLIVKESDKIEEFAAYECADRSTKAVGYESTHRYAFIDEDTHDSICSTGEDHLQGFYYPCEPAFNKSKGPILVMRLSQHLEEIKSGKKSWPDVSFFLKDDLDSYLKWNKSINGVLRPKLEKLHLECKMKLEQLKNQKSLYASTGDERYAKAIKKACRKIDMTIKELLALYSKAITEEICSDSIGEYVGNKSYLISDKKLAEFFGEKMTLQSALGELKMLHSQVSALSREVLRKDCLLVEASTLGNKMRNLLKHYDQLSPDLERQYDKYVSSCCSPSLQFGENEEFRLCTLFVPESEGSNSSNAELNENTIACCRDDIAKYFTSFKERLHALSIQTASIPELTSVVEDWPDFTKPNNTGLQYVLRNSSGPDFDFAKNNSNREYEPFIQQNVEMESASSMLGVSNQTGFEIDDIMQEESDNFPLQDGTFVFSDEVSNEIDNLFVDSTTELPVTSDANYTFTFEDQDDNAENVDPVSTNDMTSQGLMGLSNVLGLLTVPDVVTEFINSTNTDQFNMPTLSSPVLQMATESPSLLLPPKSYRNAPTSQPEAIVAEASQPLNTTMTFSSLKPPVKVATSDPQTLFGCTFSKSESGGQKRVGVGEPTLGYRSALTTGTKSSANYCFKAPLRCNGSPSKLLNNDSTHLSKPATFSSTKSTSSYSFKNTPRSASPSSNKSYQIGIGANKPKAGSSSSVGKIPSAKRVPQERSPYAANKVKQAISKLRRTSSSTSSLHKRNPNPTSLPLLNVVKSKLGQHQEKGKWQPSYNAK